MADRAKDMMGVCKELLELATITLTCCALPLKDRESSILQVADRSCKLREILTFGCTELILSHGKLLSMPQVTPILTNMYIIHNNTHMGP